MMFSLDSVEAGRGAPVVYLYCVIVTDVQSVCRNRIRNSMNHIIIQNE